MEQPSNQKYVSRDQKCVGARARQGTKLRDMLMSDKPNLSYADFHHEITRNPDDVIPNYLGSHQSRAAGRTTPKEDELVRYMSNLPSYLEKGKTFQEKPQSVGVLDWKRLEKWQHSKKPIPNVNSGYSPSSSNTSFFSTDGSSPHSSKGESCSPVQQRMHRFSMQSPVESAPKVVHAQVVKTSHAGRNCSPSRPRMHQPVVQSHVHKVKSGGGYSQETDVFGASTARFQDSTGVTSHVLSRQRKVSGVRQSDWKDPALKPDTAMTQRISDKFEVPAPWKGKTMVKGRETKKETLNLQESKSNAADQDYAKREKSGVFTKPRDQADSSCHGTTTSSYSTVNSEVSAEPGRKITSDRNRAGGSVSSTVDYRKHPDVSESCPWNPGAKSTQPASCTKPLHRTSMTSEQAVKNSSHTSHKLSFPARMFSSPSRSRNTEENKPVVALRSTGATKPSEELDARKRSESVTKARNPSPIRRLSFAMSKMIKNAGSRDNSPVRKSSSKDTGTKFGTEGDMASIIANNHCNDKALITNNRGRSSPLRRLLDPLMKSRASNTSEPPKKYPSSLFGAGNEQLDFRPGNSVKVKSRPASGSTKSVYDPHPISKDGSSSLQALLQVSFKNGLPLFTFAIDNESDILAATVRKSFVPAKGHHTWTYTFFTIREIKRKSGVWLSQGEKGDGHNLVPNVVAQMKVTDSRGSPASKHENVGDKFTREFDLFAVDVGNEDQYVTDFYPTNELAAIIIKLPVITSGNHSKDGQSSYDWLDLSHACLKEKLPDTVSYAEDNLLNHHSLRCINLGTTVILPGGVHTVPSKEEASTLAQRWKSGGSCDCGGWDLGCQLRVYSDHQQSEGKISCAATCQSEDKLQLFPQVGQAIQPMLSFAPFKERIYSVEFSSSLSLLQAFAVCISFIDCRRPAELSAPSFVTEKITDEVGVFELPIRKTSNCQVEAPARFVSCPPHSPVGRV